MQYLNLTAPWQESSKSILFLPLERSPAAGDYKRAQPLLRAELTNLITNLVF